MLLNIKSYLSEGKLVMLSSNLFFLVFLSISCDQAYFFFTGHCNEYKHLPIKSSALNLIFFFETLFLNFTNYQIFIFIFSFALYLTMPTMAGLILTFVLLLLLKISIFLITNLFSFFLSSILKFCCRDRLITFLRAFMLAVLTAIFIAPNLYNITKEHYCYYFYAAWPTHMLIKAFLEFSQNHLLAVFVYSMVIFFMIAVSFIILRKYSPAVFDDKVFFSASNRFDKFTSKKIYSYEQSSIYFALLKKELHYFIFIIIYVIIFEIPFIVIIANGGYDQDIVHSILLSLVTLASIMLYSQDMKKLVYLKSLPFSIQTVYWIKAFSAACANSFIIFIMFILLYFSSNQKLVSYSCSYSFLLLAGLNIWFSIYLTDLLLFFYFRKKSIRFFSKRAFINFMSTFFIIFITFYYSIDFTGICSQRLPANFWLVIIFFAIFHATIHNMAIKRFEEG